MRSPPGLTPRGHTPKLLTLTETHKHLLQVYKANKLLPSPVPAVGLGLEEAPWLEYDSLKL